jgi:FKBP-type peptidyl-prolyl cis-trans isomerase FkpA
MPAMASISVSKIGPLVVLVLLAACSGKPEAPPAPTGNAAPAKSSAVTALQSLTLKPGTGATVAGGQIAVVQYTGWLYEASATENKGKQFDSSRTAGQAFKFPLGTGSVIKGWDQGVAGMKIGESRRLIIPPDLAYGDNGAGGGLIPPGATLVFDIDLIAIE